MNNEKSDVSTSHFSLFICHLSFVDMIKALALSMVLAFTAGCRQEAQLRTPGQELPTLTQQPSATAMSGHLLRRTAHSLPMSKDIDVLHALAFSNAPNVPITAQKTGNGILLRIENMYFKDDNIVALLHDLGFEANKSAAATSQTLTAPSTAMEAPDGMIWSRPLAFEDVQIFEKKILSMQHDTACNAEQLVSTLAEARQPGVGKLVYTGHPLDIAFGDASKPSHYFLTVEFEGAREFIPGGRIFVSEDGGLYIDNFRLAGVFQKISASTEQVFIRADGHVIACQPDGNPMDVGKLQIVRLKAFSRQGTAYRPSETEQPEVFEWKDGETPIRTGHLEFPPTEQTENQKLLDASAKLHILSELKSVMAIALLESRLNEPVNIYADLPWSEEHLKALGIAVTHTPGRTTIPPGINNEELTSALTKVLQVLQLRLSIHEQNLRNAERIRDAENRINPYRRKTLKIGTHGEAVEGLDPAPFPKTFKLGDPNADAEGFVSLPNVNRSVETAEFQATVEEYKLVRTLLERISSRIVFPDPPQLPQRNESRE